METPKATQAAPVIDAEDAEIVTAQPTQLVPIERPLASLAMLEHAEKVAQRLVQTAVSVRGMAIAKLTQPQDWILFKDREGNEQAMLGASGVAKIRAPYGLFIEPLPGGTLEPQRITSEDGKRQGYSMRFLGGSRFLGIEQEMEAIRWDGEKFLGREDSPSDPKLSTYTLGMSKIARDLIGLKGVPADELRAAGLDVSKCKKGSGYGTSQERGAQGVAEAGVAEQAEALWKEILRRTSGDEEAARQTLKEITSYPAGTGKNGAYKAFSGVDSWQKMTKEQGIRIAKEKLSKHPQWGDHAGERQPGEDG